jgi:hypothetical protein
VIEKTGRKIEDFESIYELGIEEYDIVKMVPTLYNETSIDFHVQKLNYILTEKAPFLNKASGK